VTWEQLQPWLDLRLELPIGPLPCTDHLRRAHAVEIAARTRPAHGRPRQLGHSNLGITSICLQGIDNAEIIEALHARRAPVVPVSASLRV
jgi:hypothetical protein